MLRWDMILVPPYIATNLDIQSNQVERMFLVRSRYENAPKPETEPENCNMEFPN